MPAKEIIDIPWPIKGLNENAAYGRTPEGATLDCLNVRPYDALEKRLRGGQRTGLSKYFPSQINGSNTIQAMESVVQAFDPDTIVADETVFEEAYPGTYSTGTSLASQSDDWDEYHNIFQTLGGDGPTVESNGVTETGSSDVSSAHLVTDLSPGEKYIFEVDVFWAAGTFNDDSSLELCFRLGTSPGDRDYYLVYIDDDDLSIRRSDGGSYTTLDSDNGVLSTDTTHTITIEVSGDDVKVKLDGVLKFEQTMGSYASNTRFGLVYQNDGKFVQGIRISTANAPASLRTTRLVLVSGGSVYSGASSEAPSAVASGGSVVRASGRVGIQDAFQDVFFCDGITSNYSYYDLGSNQVKDWATNVTAGTLPQGSVDATKACRIIALYRGRIVMSGLEEEPQNWFMSKSGDPFDWDYTPSTTSPIQAVAGNNSNVGELGDVVTALAPFQDDVMIMGGANTLWVMRGDPAAGGAIDNISQQIGIVGPDAWTYDPSGNFYFFGANGLYRMAPSGGQPELLSKNRLDTTFEAVDTFLNQIMLIYDYEWQGVHIFISPGSQPTAASEHYFWDERTDSFWKDQYPAAHGPTAVQLYNADSPEDRAILLSGYDGYVRFFNPDSKDDDGTAIVSRIRFAPIQPGSMFASARAEEFTFITDDNGDGVTFKLFTGDTPEAANAAAEADGRPRVQKTLQAGRNRPLRQRVAQNAFVPVIEQIAADSTWAYETGGAAVAVLNRMHFKRV